MRYTEMPNPLTTQLDSLDTRGKLHVLGQADREIFGSSWGAGLLDPEVLEQLRALGERIREVLNHPKGRVILAGAGTSGRIAYYVSESKSRQLGGAKKVHGLIAGGTDAFFYARERVEDLPERGCADIEPLLRESGPVVYVGITCGLSAAYIAGQMGQCFKRKDTTVSVIGFNPVEDANDRMLAGLGQSFRSLLQENLNHPHFFMINPVIGPEPLTGSTRMKGGTATLILLEMLFFDGDHEFVLKKIKELQSIWYDMTEDLESAIESGHKALEEGGSLVYLSGPEYGFLAFLDASECPPTFSAGDHQVRAFVDPSFQDQLKGLDLNGKLFADFDWGPTDWVINLGELIHTADSVNNKTFLLQAYVNDSLPASVKELVKQLSMKWKLNALTTCVFTMAGKVLGNRMIDLKISNLKLWGRAVHIISHVSGLDSAKVTELLESEIRVRSHVNELDEARRIELASKMPGLVSFVARKALELFNSSRDRLE